MVLCDTNVIIELLKGNDAVLKELEKIGPGKIIISAITSMEIYYGAINNRELKQLKENLSDINTININNEISNIATDLILKYANSHNLEIPDALIAASAIAEEIPLFTYNIKDFQYIKNLNLYKI